MDSILVLVNVLIATGKQIVKEIKRKAAKNETFMIFFLLPMLREMKGTGRRVAKFFLRLCV